MNIAYDLKVVDDEIQCDSVSFPLTHFIQYQMYLLSKCYSESFCLEFYNIEKENHISH